MNQKRENYFTSGRSADQVVTYGFTCTARPVTRFSSLARRKYAIVIRSVNSGGRKSPNINVDRLYLFTRSLGTRLLDRKRSLRMRMRYRIN